MVQRDVSCTCTESFRIHNAARLTKASSPVSNSARSILTGRDSQYLQTALKTKRMGKFVTLDLALDFKGEVHEQKCV